MMHVVVYLDLAFFLNGLSDALALFVTARLSGLPLKPKRLLPAALLGATYGMLCQLPPLAAAGRLLPQALAAAALVRLAFGKRRGLLRLALLFFLLSCALGGAFLAAGALCASPQGKNLLLSLNWKAFFLAAAACFLLLSVVFRGGARHDAAGQLRQAAVLRSGRRAAFTVLLDTGHTLSDALTGAPVLTVFCDALAPLWSDEERPVLARLPDMGPVWCLEHLPVDGSFRLLPYTAVGVGSGLLLCFQAEALLNGSSLGPTTIAISPNALSDGGRCAALWGGPGEEDPYVA